MLDFDHKILRCPITEENLTLNDLRELDIDVNKDELPILKEV